MFKRKKKKENIEYFVFGLGNKGGKYHRTRHNAGFDVLDIILEKYGGKFTRGNKIYNHAVVKIADKSIMLIKPQTYMNNSGEAVKSIVNEYRAAKSKIIIVYDDVDIALSKIRIKDKGSAGSHNGMKSIINAMGTDEFIRVRVGIGKNTDDIIDHVLNTYSENEAKSAFQGYSYAANAVIEIVSNDIVSAQQKYN